MRLLNDSRPVLCTAVCIAVLAGTRASSEIIARHRAVFSLRCALISRVSESVRRVIVKYLKLAQNIPDRFLFKVLIAMTLLSERRELKR